MSACHDKEHTYECTHIGTAVFRRSDAGHENWADQRTRFGVEVEPGIPPGDARGDTALQILEQRLDDGRTNRLADSENNMMDTIMVLDHGIRDGYRLHRKGHHQLADGHRINNGQRPIGPDRERELLLRRVPHAEPDGRSSVHRRSSAVLHHERGQLRSRGLWKAGCEV